MNFFYKKGNAKIIFILNSYYNLLILFGKEPKTDEKILEFFFCFFRLKVKDVIYN